MITMMSSRREALPMMYFQHSPVTHPQASSE